LNADAPASPARLRFGALPVPPTEPTIELRRAQLADAALVLRLIHEGFASLKGRIVPESGAFAETVESVGRALAQGGALASIGGAPAGCVLFRREADALYLGRLAVLPEFRRRGVAAALVQFVETQARRQGLARLTLGVRLALADNRRLFGALGFVETALLAHDGHAEPTQARMEKRLD
jgi:ribosomal protein S18 acetylase RimI-like enzyme